ncbi:Transcriptional regulator, AbiEi antitoxin, Type IV TA system [Pseudobutyrivibrio sp. ACV-2]|uniref:type IV toxin-antitoxin system AbiEi family antitoxin domain-containing protein n=1 Tax=Pseudobutyrivibrio sp. ACV-2 TaxID=1520801 RepID=UPI00089BE65C|nr:type IV toxin-antitoxin system AbiEi family antitoxin domain-containing protein [Pseudobutyrivibrio sp. ACV-2]SEA85023.1 Transcriptional regulator, AbiEi antitoxin, Type IV TA system [Pseudobutyrivibrio sp. ACV-2]
MEMLLSRDEKKQYQLEQINDLVEANGGLVKASDIDALGVDYRRVLKFVDEGYLIRVKSGYYTTKYFECDEDQWIYKLFGEDGILTMESALYVYGYLKDRPYKWSIAINKNTSKSRFNIDYPIVEPYYTEPEVLEIGVTEADFAGAKMKIYTKERLICDFLKYQEKVDREDFKKGVWAYIMDENKDVAKLMEYAKERKVLKKVQSMIGVWL